MPEARALQPGDPERLGGYEVTGRLGEGGQGVVYLGRGPASSHQTPPTVAIKLLHARLADGPAARTRFARELDPAKHVATYSTAALLDADVAGDRPYIVSEYVDGPSLQALVAAEGPRGRSALERVAIGTATALTAIHQAGVVHRDFKPANVLLGNDGPRVIDFGISRALAATGAAFGPGLFGTPGYMSPEQLGGAEVGPASDVFSWGSTLLFAATGRLPFGDDAVSTMMQRIMYEQPDLSALPDSLRELVAEALAKEPADRPAARLLLDRLLAQEGPVRGMPASMAQEARSLAVEQLPRPAAALLAQAAEPDTAPLAEIGYPERQFTEGQTAVYPGLPPAGADTALQPHPLEAWQGSSWPGQPPAAAGEPPPPAVPVPARRDNRPLGVLISLAVGVLAGAAIIVLVLWPQLEGSEGKRGGTTRPAADNQPVNAIPQGFAGTWKGTAVNPQRNASFPVEVTFEPGKTTARAHYPARDCTCVLTLTRGTGSRLEMDLRPEAACAPKAVTPGQVVVTKKPDGTLEYAWAKAGTALSYRGTLSSS
jgi:predicted Ser/Thr protein kinase